jgi:hypothetical protein
MISRMGYWILNLPILFLPYPAHHAYPLFFLIFLSYLFLFFFSLSILYLTVTVSLTRIARGLGLGIAFA